MITLLLLALVVVPESAPPTPYPLDDVDRTMPARGPVVCPRVPLVLYRGGKLLYRKPARVHPAFAERLRKFEDLVIRGRARAVRPRTARAQPCGHLLVPAHRPLPDAAVGARARQRH
jgi:hypothetical protein